MFTLRVFVTPSCPATAHKQAEAKPDWTAYKPSNATGLYRRWAPVTMQQQPRAGSRQQPGEPGAHHHHHAAPLTMHPLPSIGGLQPQRPYGAVQDWSQALGNLQDAKLAVEGLRALVHDAVYLDEEAYSSAVSQTQQQSVLQASREKFTAGECVVTLRLGGPMTVPPSDRS